MVSTRTLGKIAVVGAFIAIGGAFTIKNKLQRNFKNTEYYKQSAALLRKYKPAIEAFGEPIRCKSIDLGDTELNRVDGLNAKLAIPVQGPKAKGTLYTLASRKQYGDKWEIDQLDLEVSDRPGVKRWTFYIKKH